MVSKKVKAFTKTDFQSFWGDDGYVENFSYGVGIEKVCEIALYPFIRGKILEIGSGGGSFTSRIKGDLIAIDVIKKPKLFNDFNLHYIELDNEDYKCTGVKNELIDFCFSYGCFCHLPNRALKEYLKSVNRVLRSGGDFVFMLSDFDRGMEFIEQNHKYKLGDMTSRGHFYQDQRTLDIIMGDGWDVISRDMIPNHRERLIHLRRI